MSISTFVRRRAGITVLALVGLALTSCSSLTGASDSSSGAASGSELTIGVLAPLTGGSAADGKLAQQGAQLAIDHLNAGGGVKGHRLKLDVVDVKDQTSAAVSAAVTQLTADSSVVAVVTGYASTTNFEIDLLAQAGMPYILGGNSTQTEGIISKNPSKYPGVWSIAPTYAGYSTEFPKVLENWNSDGTFKLRNQNAYIISNSSPYASGVATGLQSTLAGKGWAVTGPDTVPFGAVDDWTTQITKVHSKDPSVVINTDYLTANAAKFLTQFRQNPTNSLVFSLYAPSVPEFLTLAGPNADGVIYNLPFSPLQTLQRTKDLTQEYTSKYNTAPGLYGIALYEQVMLWAAAANQVGDPSQKDKVGAAIGTLTEKTSLGTVQFDPKTHLAISGDNNIPFTFYQIQNGKRVTIAPAAYAEGKFVTPSWIK